MTPPTSPPACAAYPRGAVLTCVACQHQEHATSADCKHYHDTNDWPRHCDGVTMVVRRLRDR